MPSNPQDNQIRKLFESSAEKLTQFLRKYTASVHTTQIFFFSFLREAIQTVLLIE